MYPTLQEAYAKGSSLAVHLTWPAEVVTLAGAPTDSWIVYDFSSTTSTTVSANVILVNKTATRLPEAMFVRFQPDVLCRWSVKTFDSYIDMQDVVEGGARNMHSTAPDGDVTGCPTSTSSSSSSSSSSKSNSNENDSCLRINSIDAGLVRFGTPFGLPTPLTQTPDPTQGAAIMLVDNLWGTNYPMWFPFDAADATLQFRFEVSL